MLREGRTTDGVHPDPFGHEAIARHLHRVLAPALGVEVDPRDSLVPAPSAEYRAGAGWGGTWWDAFERSRTPATTRHCAGRWTRCTRGSAPSARGPGPGRSEAPRVHYLDLRPLFLEDGGTPAATMAGDALHISGAGKAAWRAAVEGWIQETGAVSEGDR